MITGRRRAFREVKLHLRDVWPAAGRLPEEAQPPRVLALPTGDAPEGARHVRVGRRDLAGRLGGFESLFRFALRFQDPHDPQGEPGVGRAGRRRCLPGREGLLQFARPLLQQREAAQQQGIILAGAEFGLDQLAHLRPRLGGIEVEDREACLGLRRVGKLGRQFQRLLQGPPRGVLLTQVIAIHAHVIEDLRVVGQAGQGFLQQGLRLRILAEAG